MSTLYKTFDDMSESVRTLATFWNEQSKGKTKSYFEIQKNLQKLNQFLVNEINDKHREIEKLREEFNPKKVDEGTEKINNDIAITIKNIKNSAIKDIQGLKEAKQEKIKKMLLAPPTNEQLNLLQALQLRDDLTVAEITHILSSFFENYNAVKSLNSVAARQGINISLPVQLDVRAMFENIEKVENYLIRAVDELGQPIQKMDIKYHAFYTENPEDKEKSYDPLYNEMIATLDSVPQLSDCTTNKTSLSNTEKVKVDYYFKDVQADDTDIKNLQKVKSIMEKHPQDVELIKLSTYAPLVSMVESATNE